MEEKRLTEQESLAIIAEMIQKTKQELWLDRSRRLLIWGYVCVCAAVLNYLTLMLTHNSAAMLWWLLIPLAGLPLQRRIKSRGRSRGEAKSYVESITRKLWILAATVIVAAIVMNVFFGLMVYHRVWIIINVVSLSTVGMASDAQGIIIRESSLVGGGIVGVAVGIFVGCCAIAGLNVNYVLIMPLFIVSMIVMIIVPVHIISRKERELCSKS